MAEALARRAIEAGGLEASVGSAGFAGDGVPASPGAAAVMAEWGLDLQAHRSRQLTPPMVASADLVLTMTRQHLLDVVLLSPDRWSHCFTIVDAVRRAKVIGPRPAALDMEEWVNRLDGGRTRPELLALGRADDIADPMGRRRRAYAASRDRLDHLVSALVGSMYSL